VAQRDEFHANQVGGVCRERLAAAGADDADADNFSTTGFGVHSLEFARWLMCSVAVVRPNIKADGGE